MATTQSNQQQDQFSPSIYHHSPDSRRISEDVGKVDDGETSEESATEDGSRKRKRTSRPISISCELCKQRKVKCDRGRPSCGWCLRNDQICEYKERKKPGLRKSQHVYPFPDVTNISVRRWIWSRARVEAGQAGECDAISAIAASANQSEPTA